MLASPIGGVPDEPAHMTYAWGLTTGQGPGGPDPTCEPFSVCPVTVYDVPDGLIPNPGCYIFRPDVTVECTERGGTTAGTAATRYPPPFYLWTGASMRVAHSLGGGPDTVGIVGRLAAALLAGSMLYSALLLGVKGRLSIAAGTVTMLTPMALFLAASINPNGVEFAGAIAVASAIGYRLNDPQPSFSVAAIYGWGAFWLAWSRPIGWIWLAILSFFGLLLLRRRFGALRLKEFLQQERTYLLFTASSGLSAFAWFLYAAQAHATSADTGRTMPDDGTGRWIALALRFGDMATESLGVLGWLDTTIPRLFQLALLVAIIGSALLAWRSADRVDRTICLAYFATLIVAIFLIMERQSFLWQGRYALPPIAAALVLLTSVANDQTDIPLIRLASLTWLAATPAAFWLYARNAFGLIRGSRYLVPDFSQDAQWTPYGGIALFVLLGVLATTTGMLLLRQLVLRQTRTSR